MDAAAAIAEVRSIAVGLGLHIDDLYGYPPSFEAYLIQMRIRAHLARLRTEIHTHEAAQIVSQMIAYDEAA